MKGLARSPTEAQAVPKNREKMTICKISFVAIALIILVGKAFNTKSLKLKASGTAGPSFVRVREIDTPGYQGQM